MAASRLLTSLRWATATVADPYVGQVDFLGTLDRLAADVADGCVKILDGIRTSCEIIVTIVTNHSRRRDGVTIVTVICKLVLVRRGFPVFIVALVVARIFTRAG